MLLYFNLNPKHNHIYAAHLANLIEENNGRLTSGFIGVSYLAPALADNGYAKTAFTLLQQEAFPSWISSIRPGATTIWERWDSYTVEKGFGPVEMNSFNHYAYGAVIEWVYRNAAGIKPALDGAGFQKIYLEPQPNPRLNWLKVKYDSACGPYRSEWEISPEGLTFIFEIPFNGEAELTLPDAPNVININGEQIKYTSGMKLIKGIYTISYQPVKPYYITYDLDSPASIVFEREDLKSWLKENIPEFNNIMFFVFMSPINGTLREFLESQGIKPSTSVEQKLKTAWRDIRSWQ
jgi:alpha-L-rhamnosidase